MGLPKAAPSPAQIPGDFTVGHGTHVSAAAPPISAQLLKTARAQTETTLKEFASRSEGLSQLEAFLFAMAVAVGLTPEMLLIIHVIRTNKIPFIQSRASWPLIVSSLIIVTVGAWLTVSPLAGVLGFVPLPPLYWLLLALMLPCYVVLTQVVKTWFIRRYGE
jgi:hypothetical protein